MLKWLVTQKLKFLYGFPYQYKTFLYITCTFTRPSLQLFRIKIQQFFPFLHEIRYNLAKKGQISEFLTVNNQGLGR